LFLSTIEPDEVHEMKLILGQRRYDEVDLLKIERGEPKGFVERKRAECNATLNNGRPKFCVKGRVTG
jgi:hypothetical protein